MGEVIEVLRTEVNDRMAAASEYERLGRAEQASKLHAEAAVIRSFLEGPFGEPC
jgi:uncharacterized protein YqeY